MITRCLQNQIVNATGKLQPTILTAILNIYNRGLRLIKARDVRKECKKINNSVPWDRKISAICNAMRNATDCGGRVIGIYKPYNDFTISLDDNKDNLNSEKEDKILKVEKEDKIEKKPTENLVEINDIIENTLTQNFDWSKIQNKSEKKLLIIGCANTKIPGGGNLPENNCFEDPNLYNNLLIDRGKRNNQYSDFIVLNPNYFNKRRSGLGDVNDDYFNTQLLAPAYLPAFERYAGKFYNPRLRNLYIQKNQESNLHILIISGLYGVIEFRDSIIDYHLEINKPKFWTKENNNSILEAVKKYIEVNEISNDMVFHSLSDKYRNVLDVNHQWKNLWIKVDYGDISAKFLEQTFLPRL